MHTHVGGTKAVFRVRKKGAHGSYRIVTEDVKSNTSREDLLFMRSKKKSDRHCS
jgi:hypothetical protein